jgi:DNA-binding NtrC family response regulator
MATFTRIASAPISTAGCPPSGSICRRCAIVRTTCRRSRCGCWTTQAALALFGALTWPGNLAELRTAVERVVADGGGDVIQIEHILPVLQLHRAHSPFVPSGNLREARQRFERDYIASVLQHHDWRMAPAAQALGIQRPNLYRKARQLGIPLVRVSE